MNAATRPRPDTRPRPGPGLALGIGIGPDPRPDSARVGLVRARPGEDLNLLAGQLWFGHEARSVSTLLGSCVAVTLWHPARRIGGMCHFLLPQRQHRAGMPRDGRFGEEALDMLVEAIVRSGARCTEFEAHLYGGADTMPDRVGAKLNVGERNIELGWSMIERWGFMLCGVDVGDQVPRHVRLLLATGEVAMRRREVLTEAA
jgi:chemotaxis protein CheD